jgi:hypothetical protein
LVVFPVGVIFSSRQDENILREWGPMSPIVQQQMKLDLRPELELIVCCARLRPDITNEGRIRELLRSELSWSEIVANAVQHKLDPVVYERLSAVGGDLVSEAQRKTLRDAVCDTAKSVLGLLREMLRLYERFEAEQIPIVPYKGPLLAWLAYRSFTKRSYADLDFAVPQSYVPRAAAVLQSEGYHAEFDLRDAHADRSGYVPGQYPFYSNTQSILVELHTERTLRYFPVPLNFEEINRRLIHVEIAGRKLRTFSVEDTLVMLCVHGAKHFWERLCWILDVAELIAMQPVDWLRTMRIAKELKSERTLLLGLYLAHEVLGASLPIPILEQSQQDSNVRWLAKQVCNQLAGKEDPATGVVPRAEFRLRSRDRIVDGVRHMLRLATSPTETDRQSVRLPRALFPLYALVRPWRLLREYGFGARRRAKPDLAIFKPTPSEVADRMLRLAEISTNDVLYDLGCGDGRIVVTAAEEFDVRAVGIDISPKRIAEARANARRHGVEDRVRFFVQDAKQADLSGATIVTLFIGASGNLRLVDRLRTQLRPGARIVSRNYRIYGWPADKCETYVLPNGIPTILYLWRIKERVEETRTGKPVTLTPEHAHEKET